MRVLDMDDIVWDNAILHDMVWELQRQVNGLQWELGVVRARMLREISRLERVLLLSIEDWSTDIYPIETDDMSVGIGFRFCCNSSSGDNNNNNGQQEEDEDDNEVEDDDNEAEDDEKKYESEGLVSTMGDVYSYSIMLTETVRVVTRILLRPLQESFVEELSLKRWVFESFPDRVVNVVDANLFSRQDEQFSSKETCVKLLMELTLQCTSESPQDRISMKDVLFTIFVVREMSRLSEAAAMKRKRPNIDFATQGLVDDERKVLNLVKSKENQVTGEKKLPNIQNKARHHFIAVEFEPSDELTGGAWYSEGKLDEEFITGLRKACLKVLEIMKVATVEGIYEFLKKRKVVECTSQQVGEILNAMVLDDGVIEVKSTGLGEYHNIPVGSVCYRTVAGEMLQG
ncbi:hypothetical protein CQW23_01032 [Capsicum baccatum]|uniref:Uncharacterized protein n=1 Tax=Capsicum baccatum TaxID=33114 RepID=A0A2G2XMI9_CAPBA|nr:hypothetical protein CQW23_01032 [Capsicum baccatum]